MRKRIKLVKGGEEGREGRVILKRPAGKRAVLSKKSLLSHNNCCNSGSPLFKMINAPVFDNTRSSPFTSDTPGATTPIALIPAPSAALMSSGVSPIIYIYMVSHFD